MNTQYDFDPNANPQKVQLHYDTLIQGLKYYKKKYNELKCDQIRQELSQMRSVYKYLN